MLYKADWFWVKTQPGTRRWHLADKIFGDEGTLCGKSMPAAGWGEKEPTFWGFPHYFGGPIPGTHPEFPPVGCCRECKRRIKNLPYVPLDEPSL